MTHEAEYWFAEDSDAEDYEYGGKTLIEAIDAAFASCGGDSVSVGTATPPAPLESLVCAYDILEMVDAQAEGHPDYSLECAEYDLHDATKAAKDELAASFRNMLGKWLDKHGLRPTHVIIENQQTYTLDDLKRLKQEEAA